jgi:hypothetical protein
VALRFSETVFQVLGLWAGLLAASRVAAAIIVSLFMRSQTIQNHPLPIACAFVGAFYLHHAFSRADFSHLAQVIHPFPLAAPALLGFLGARKSYHWAVIAVLIAAALFTVGRQTPIYRPHLADAVGALRRRRQNFCASQYRPAIYLCANVRLGKYRAARRRTHRAIHASLISDP